MKSERDASGQWLDWLYGSVQLRRQITHQYPNEEILFLSGGMLVPKDPTDDNLQRVTLSARRGVMAITPARLVFITSLWMPMNIMFMIAGGISAYLWFRGGGFPAMILTAFAVASVIRRRPFHVEILLADIRHTALKSVQQATGSQHALIVHGDERSYQIVTTSEIPLSVKDLLHQIR